MSTSKGRKIALVTGAAQGIGLATALRLSADGFAVAVNDIVDDGRLDALAERIDGLAVHADISLPESATDIVQTVRNRLGDIDLFVANAASLAMGPFLEQSQELWWRQIDVNLSGHFRLVQTVVPGMRRSGGGRIVIIASGWGIIGQSNATAYSASKSGLIALTKGLGRELAPFGILTNAIAPSYVGTVQLQIDADFDQLSLADMCLRYQSSIPTGELATAEEIAAAVAFLASDDAAAFVGQVLQPSGGVTMTRA
jgi:2-hydroxycyclohexanecarboxyl-CoA dehydrogenase